MIACHSNTVHSLLVSEDFTSARETAGVFCAGGEGKRYFGNTKYNFTQRSVNCSWRSGVSLEATKDFDHGPLFQPGRAQAVPGFGALPGKVNSLVDSTATVNYSLNSRLFDHARFSDDTMAS